MRNHLRVVSGLLPLCGALVGCSGGEDVGSGEARILLAAQGGEAVTMHVTATNEATGDVVLDRTVEVEAGAAAVLDILLAAAVYTVHVDTSGAAGGIGSGEARAEIHTDTATEVTLTAYPGGDVRVGVNGAPRIHDVRVVAASGLDGSARITIEASDPEGAALTFFWSGLALDGAVQGSSTLTLSALDALVHTGGADVHVVVQDSAGATTVGRITFAGEGSCLVCGEHYVASGNSVGGEACLAERALCDVDCGPDDVEASLSCLAGCALELAACEAG
jgi:hypothetical protein